MKKNTAYGVERSSLEVNSCIHHVLQCLAAHCQWQLKGVADLLLLKNAYLLTNLWPFCFLYNPRHLAFCSGDPFKRWLFPKWGSQGLGRFVAVPFCNYKANYALTGRCDVSSLADCLSLLQTSVAWATDASQNLWLWSSFWHSRQRWPSYPVGSDCFQVLKLLKGTVIINICVSHCCC